MCSSILDHLLPVVWRGATRGRLVLLPTVHGGAAIVHTTDKVANQCSKLRRKEFC
jgi:hypothetical protein